jgi:hypothetical protein
MDVGDTIAGKYRVDHLIGKGGMGSVFAATNAVIGKKVAVNSAGPSIADWSSRSSSWSCCADGASPTCSGTPAAARRLDSR